MSSIKEIAPVAHWWNAQPSNDMPIYDTAAEIVGFEVR